MASKAKNIMEKMASYFTQDQAALPDAGQDSITPDVKKAAKKDIADTFKTDPSRDYNAKIRKALGFSE